MTINNKVVNFQEYLYANSMVILRLTDVNATMINNITENVLTLQQTMSSMNTALQNLAVNHHAQQPNPMSNQILTIYLSPQKPPLQHTQLLQIHTLNVPTYSPLLVSAPTFMPSMN